MNAILEGVFEAVGSIFGENVGCAVSAFILAALIGIACVYDAASCSSRWRHSGKASDWGPIQGCLVEVEPGRWIPDDRLREVEP